MDARGGDSSVGLVKGAAAAAAPVGHVQAGRRHRQQRDVGSSKEGSHQSDASSVAPMYALSEQAMRAAAGPSLTLFVEGDDEQLHAVIASPYCYSVRLRFRPPREHVVEVRQSPLIVVKAMGVGPPGADAVLKTHQDGEVFAEDVARREPRRANA